MGGEGNIDNWNDRGVVDEASGGIYDKIVQRRAV